MTSSFRAESANIRAPTTKEAVNELRLTRFAVSPADANSPALASRLYVGGFGGGGFARGGIDPTLLGEVSDDYRRRSRSAFRSTTALAAAGSLSSRPSAS